MYIIQPNALVWLLDCGRHSWKCEKHSLKPLHILLADKGNKTVVMDSSEYQRKLWTYSYVSFTLQKSHRQYWKTLDATRRLHCQGIINGIVKDGLIHNTPTFHRCTADSRFARRTTWSRPIVLDQWLTYLYTISKELACILSPLTGKTDSYMKNSGCV